LTPGETYHFRSQLDVDSVLSNGVDDSFTFTMPTISTLAASGVIMTGGGTQATLRGSVTNMGVASDTYLYFEWGYDTSYGNVVGLQTVGVVGTYTTNITGYSPNSTVFYRVVTLNGTETVLGGAVSFKVTPTTTFSIMNIIPLAFMLCGVIALFVLKITPVVILTSAILIIVGAIMVISMANVLW